MTHLLRFSVVDDKLKVRVSVAGLVLLFWRGDQGWMSSRHGKRFSQLLSGDRVEWRLHGNGWLPWRKMV